MSDEISTHPLPGDRIELRWGKCIPVIMTAETYRSKSTLEVMKVVSELTLNAYQLEKQGYDLPLTTGIFVQDEEVAEGYLLRVPEQRGHSLRVLFKAHPPSDA